jgi:hypothetical protein
MTERPDQPAEPPLRIGERVSITDGPFRGMEAVVVEDWSPRVILSLQLIRSVVDVEMDREWVRRAIFTSPCLASSVNQDAGLPRTGRRAGRNPQQERR